MKAATVIAVALAALSSFPSTAQQQPAQQQPPVQQQQDQQMQQPPAPMAPTASQSQPSSQTQAQQGATGQNATAADLKPVTGELVGKLDTKSAKQGDSVVVKTKQDVKFTGGAEIPKGSKLVGHVTNVQPRGDGKENSQIAIQFDRAELKSGQTVGIESVIQSVSPAAGSGTDNSSPGAFGASPAAPNAPTPSGTTPSSPAMNGSSSSTANDRPGLASNTTAQQGQTDQNTNSGMPAPGSIVARQGNIAIRMTAIPGVLLANDINGLPFTNASGLLVGARRDVHLDEGTQMVLAVAGIPQRAGSGMSR